MVNAHPQALRQRVVEAYAKGEGTQRELCERFKLSMGAVNAWIQQSRQTGSVEPPAGKGGNLSEITKEDLEAILAEKKDLTQAERADKLQEKDIACSRSGVNRALARFGLTRKKNRHDPERDQHEPERQAFRTRIRHLPNRHLVVIDEAGIWSHMSRTHGYAPKGERVESVDSTAPQANRDSRPLDRGHSGSLDRRWRDEWRPLRRLARTRTVSAHEAWRHPGSG